MDITKNMGAAALASAQASNLVSGAPETPEHARQALALHQCLVAGLSGGARDRSMVVTKEMATSTMATAIATGLVPADLPVDQYTEKWRALIRSLLSASAAQEDPVRAPVRQAIAEIAETADQLALVPVEREG